MKTELISIRKVKPNPENPRTIKDAAFKRLVKSLEDCPDLFNARPLLCSDRTGELVVLGGNMRLRAAKELKYKEVPVIIMKGLTEEQEREIAIKDNGAFGEWDYDALANDWSHLPLADWGVDIPDDFVAPSEPEDNRDAEPQIDRAEELNKEWKVQPGDLWLIGEHRLLCGDSTKAEDVGKVMGGEKARMCFTDPPWNVAIGGDANPRHRQRAGLQNDNLPHDEFTGFLNEFAALMPGVVTGDVYCVLGASEWPTLDNALRGIGYHWSATIIWVKDVFVLGRSKYHRRYEPIWYGWHKQGNSSFGHARDLDDVWEIPRPRVSDEHPTMKPVDLVKKAIFNSSISSDVIYEPFCGSGTTMVACQNLSRKCRGIEISPAYCAVILERMKTAFPELKIERAENGNI